MLDSNIISPSTSCHSVLFSCHECLTSFCATMLCGSRVRTLSPSVIVSASLNESVFFCTLFNLHSFLCKQGDSKLTAKAGDGCVKKVALGHGGATSSAPPGVSIFCFNFLLTMLPYWETKLVLFFLDGPTRNIQPRNGLYAASGNYLNFY
jgi:hypothetical protein